MIKLLSISKFLALSVIMNVLNISLLLSVLKVNVGDVGIITIEDSGDLFKSGTLGFDVEEEDEDELDSDPDL